MYNLSENRWKHCAPNYGQINLMNELRKLWEEHVFWSRFFIISTMGELPDLEATTKRLFRNPADFAKVLEIYYGRPKAETFRGLFEEYIKIAGSILNNAKQGNNKAVEQYSRLWESNADQIAAFFAGINPNWSEHEWNNFLHDHLRMITDAVMARLSGEYIKDSIIFDIIEEQALAMADAMAAGMIRQFNI